MKFSSEYSDEALMISFQSGSHEAFEVLFERHKGKVYSYIKRRVHSPEDSEEKFQQVFVKLTHSRLTYNKDYAFTQWLFTICRTTIVDFFRKNKRIERSEIQIEEAADGSVIPDLHVGDFKILSTELNEIQRVIVEMRVFDELTYEEISGKLKLSPANVRQILSRAYKKLRLALNANGGEIE